MFGRIAGFEPAAGCLNPVRICHVEDHVFKPETADAPYVAEFAFANRAVVPHLAWYRS